MPRAYYSTVFEQPAHVVWRTIRAFVEWWATFDCAEGERGHWVEHFERNGFAVWLASLRDYLHP